MAKKVETIVRFTDDFDGSKADRTVGFSLDGAQYEIDLSKKNAAAFEKVLAGYVGAARKVRTRRSSSTSATTRGGSRNDLAEIRAWAQANGHQVSNRGRVAASVVAAYDAAS